MLQVEAAVLGEEMVEDVVAMEEVEEAFAVDTKDVAYVEVAKDDVDDVEEDGVGCVEAYAVEAKHVASNEDAKLDDASAADAMEEEVHEPPCQLPELY